MQRLPKLDGPLRQYHPALRRDEEGIAEFVADPAHTAPVILQLADMDEPPLRIILGKGALPMVRDTYEKRLAEWDRWADLGESAQ